MVHRRSLLSSFASLSLATGLPTLPAPVPRSRDRRSTAIIAADGTRLHHRDWGSGPPLVLLAPWTLTTKWWEYYSASLPAAGFRCVSFDRRGHGRSDEPSSGYDFDTLADDLAAVLETLDLRDAILVGHSFGAAEVVRYLARHRAARVRAAILVATVTPLIIRTADNPGGAPADALEKARAALLQDQHGQIAAAANAFFGAPANPVGPVTIDWWTRAIIDGCSLHVALALNRAMTTTDFRGDLKGIRVPTLLVHGDADTSARLERTGQPTHALVAGSELTIYRGAAHGLTITHAERLRDDIVAFARR